MTRPSNSRARTPRHLAWGLRTSTFTKAPLARICAVKPGHSLGMHGSKINSPIVTTIQHLGPGQYLLVSVLGTSALTVADLLRPSSSVTLLGANINLYWTKESTISSGRGKYLKLFANCLSESGVADVDA